MELVVGASLAVIGTYRYFLALPCMQANVRTRTQH